MIEIKDCWMTDRCKKYPDCPEPCMKLFKLNNLCDQALLTTQQRKYIPLRLDADGCDRDAFEQLKNIELNIQEFVSSGRNLFIHSASVGCGKTSWLLRLLNSYLGKIWPTSGLSCRGLFISVPRFFIALKESLSKQNDYIDHIRTNILEADLVIFDEVGTKALTTFEMEQLLSIISARIDAGKSNMYSSNLSCPEMQEALGDRLYSRIVNNSIDITLRGKDKRGLI